MSFPLLVLAGAAQAFILAGCAVALALAVVRWLAALPERRRPWAWALLLAPFLTPALLVSYASAPLAVRAMAVPGALPALYFIALLLRLVPVAVVVLHFLPPLASAEARHCHALLAPASRQRRFFDLRAAGHGPWLAGGVVFLLAFAEFELASLWSLKTWTVTLFDAHTGGLALGESLRLAAWPLALQLAVLLALARTIGPRSEGAWISPSPRAAGRALAYLLGAGFAAALLPLGIVAGQACAGWPVLVASFPLTRDLAASLAFAFGAAIFARTVARAGEGAQASLPVAVAQASSLHSSDSQGAGKDARATATGCRFDKLKAPSLPPGKPALLRFALCAPGLLGPLVLALLLVAVFNLPLVRSAYDTPLPLLLALTLLLLPLALLLRWRLAVSETDTSLHLARTLAPATRHSSLLIRLSSLLWQLDGRRRFACFALLFYWAFTEFTASSILAPVGLTPVFARLHNLAHYGQTAGLSAMLLAAFLAPMAVLLLTAPVARFYPRRDGR